HLRRPALLRIAPSRSPATPRSRACDAGTDQRELASVPPVMVNATTAVSRRKHRFRFSPFPPTPPRPRAPEEEDGRAEEHDNKADCRLARLLVERIRDEHPGGESEENRRDGITGRAEWTRGIGRVAPRRKHRERAEPVEDPAREDHVGEQLLKRSRERENDRPARQQNDRRGRSAEAMGDRGEAGGSR